MVEWLRANLRWDFAFGIVAIVAGVFGATFIGIERFIAAEICVALSGVLLWLWAIARHGHWALKYLLVLIISAVVLFTIHWIDEFRIRKENDAFQQKIQS
ncbi:MAG: hypothetical protein WB611_09725, partial [Stellaceae bacterium]